MFSSRCYRVLVQVRMSVFRLGLANTVDESVSTKVTAGKSDAQFVKRCQALGLYILPDPESKLVPSKPTRRRNTSTIGTCRKRPRTRSSKDEQPAEEDEQPPADDKLYKIEKRLDRRVHCGRQQRQIKWVGYEDPTWEDVDHLPPSDEDDDSDEYVPPTVANTRNVLTINT